MEHELDGGNQAVRYQVICDQYHGEGATPGLALRAFWRAIERGAMRGHSAPTNCLPYRRRLRIQYATQATR